MPYAPSSTGQLFGVANYYFNGTTWVEAGATSGGATPASGTLAMGAVTTAAPAPANGTAAPLSIDTHGATRTTLQGPDGTALDFSSPTQVADFLPSLSDTVRVPIATNTIGDNIIVAAVAGQTVRVHRFRLHAVAAVTVLVKDGAGTTIETIVLAAGEKFSLTWSARPHYFTSAGNALILNLSGALQIYGRIEYVQSA